MAPMVTSSALAGAVQIAAAVASGSRARVARVRLFIGRFPLEHKFASGVALLGRPSFGAHLNRASGDRQLASRILRGSRTVARIRGGDGNVICRIGPDWPNSYKCSGPP